MSMKTQRKANVKPAYKASTTRKVRSSVSKTTSRPNGKYPLAAYEHLHIGIVEASLSGKYIDANEEFCRILGYSKKELLQLGVRDCTHEDDYAIDIKLHEQLVAGKIPFYELEKRFVRKDGGIVWGELTRSLIRDESGKPLCTIGAVIDISDRKQVERALRESVESLRMATEAARMFKWELDFQKQLYTFADNFEQVLGFSAGLSPQNSVESIWRLVPAEDVQVISEAIAKTIETHSNLNSLQYRVMNPEDGQTVWLEVNAKVIYDAEGNAQRMFGVAQNITEDKKAQEEIRVVSRMPAENPNPVMRLTPDGKILYANAASAPLLAAWTQQVEQRIPAELHKAVTDTFTAGTRTEVEIEHRGKIFSCTLAPLPEFGYVNLYGKDITERKHAEERLRASESLYRTIARSIPDGGVYVVDKDFRYLVAEGPVTEAFGLSREMLEGHTMAEVFPDERGTRMEDRLRRTFEGETVNFETEHNGRVYWTQQAPLLDSIGQAIILTLDITERKWAEAALRESEERFRAILKQATAGIVRKDAEGRLVFVNQAFCNMLDYTESELLGKTFWQFTHHEDVEENKRLYDRMMSEGVPFKLEKRLIRRDGSVIWMDTSVSPVMDVEGRPQSAVAVEVDITARKQAEEDLRQLNLQLENRVQKRTATIQAMNQSLRDEIAERKRIEEALRMSEASARESEEKLRTLFDLLPVGITFLDPEGRVLQTNSALLDIIKLSREQLFGQAYKSRKYMRADGTPMPLNEFASARALTENRTIHNVETGIILENGEVIWTSVSAAPVDVADVGVVVVTVDITETKHAERALKESHRRLRILSQRLVEVQEEERRALARELHDRVGQTLAALNINLIIINSQLSSEVTRQIGARMNDSMKLVAETIALVRDVMTDLRPAVLDDYGLEAALESQLSKFTSRYNIKAKFEKPDRPIPRLGPSVEMTFLRIAQEALMNIARHSQAKLVTMLLRREEHAICLNIHDDGIGIESWQDANRPGSHGLTIMRERADTFGGKLRVSSVPGQGTTVEVSIPFKNSDREKAQDQEQHL